MEEEEEKPGLAEALLGPEPKEGGLGRKVQAVEGLKGTELGEKGQGPVEGLLLQGEEELFPEAAPARPRHHLGEEGGGEKPRHLLGEAEAQAGGQPRPPHHAGGVLHEGEGVEGAEEAGLQVPKPP